MRFELVLLCPFVGGRFGKDLNTTKKCNLLVGGLGVVCKKYLPLYSVILFIASPFRTIAIFRVLRWFLAYLRFSVSKSTSAKSCDSVASKEAPSSFLGWGFLACLPLAVFGLWFLRMRERLVVRLVLWLLFWLRVYLSNYYLRYTKVVYLRY